MPGTRERMVVSAALLIRERGARATSIDDVLAHSGAPRGSVYHHFPGGRQQLLRVAIEAGDPKSDLHEHAAAAFGRWEEVLSQRLVADGVNVARSAELAVLVIA